MKKLLVLMMIGTFLLTGCGLGKGDALKELTKKIEDINSYYVEGVMEIINNEDIYTYDVKVSYQKDDNYLVELVNQSNNHEQIILRNSEGVYIITPSLNKSFKFQSDWPYNNSQAYLLTSLVEDLNNDEEVEVVEKDGTYTLTSTVNYPNNQKLVKQKVVLDKDYKVSSVEVVDSDNNTGIKMTYNKIDYNTKFSDDHFKLSSIITEDNTNENKDSTNEGTNSTDENNTNEGTDENTNTNENTNSSEDTNENTNTNEGTNTNENNQNNTDTTATIEDIIYPMYLPTNTYLANQEKVSTEDGERLILTFEGDSPFTLIEETIKAEEEHTIIPTFGEPDWLGDTIGVVSTNSVNWYSNGIEYYVISNALESSEILEIARSISVIPVSK